MKKNSLFYMSLFILTGIFSLTLIGCSGKSELPLITPAAPLQITPKELPPPTTTPEPNPEPELQPLSEKEPEPELFPKPETLDTPPEIIDYDIPEAVYYGDDIKVYLEAIDDIGLESVFISIETPDGIQDIPLNDTEGLWECVYTPETEGNYTLTAKVTDSKGQEEVKELGIVTVKIDTPPEIVSVELPPWIPIYQKFAISVGADDDRGIAEVKIRFEKKGKLIDEITLEKTGAGVFASTYTFKTYGYIDYIVTAIDTNGQTTTEIDEIVSEIGGGGGGDSGGSCG